MWIESRDKVQVLLASNSQDEEKKGACLALTSVSACDFLKLKLGQICGAHWAPSCKPKLFSTITKPKRQLKHGVQENNTRMKT